MTQPTSVNMTFDTSLVDLNASFSTTESEPSDAGFSNNPPITTPPLQQKPLSQDQSQDTPKSSQTATSLPAKPSTPVQHLPTQVAYDQWASIYDSDGNMLQSIDDVELANLLPNFVTQVLSSNSSAQLNILDLGCGTGRNTAKLLTYPWPYDRTISLTGLDFSKGMLAIAHNKLSTQATQTPNVTLTLQQCDCFPTTTNPDASPLPSPITPNPIHAITSTLVLEHIPLNAYFATLSALLTPKCHALVTNMHSEMGRISQAGFINAQGVKVRGESFAHTPEETADAARDAGFEVLAVMERAMEARDIEEGRVGERGWKWVGVKVWYGLLLKKIG